MTRSLAAALGVPALLTRYSRLLIDPNRGADDPTLIMRLSDGAVIPGNRRLDEAERERRTRLYYAPYHRAIDAVIDQCLASGAPPMLLSIHSFTESWKETPRPWHVGVLWDRDLRLAKPLLDGFYAEGDLIVGDNEPYSGQLEGDCLWQHATGRGLVNALIEIRQDLIRDCGRPGGLGAAALPHCPDDLERYMSGTCAGGAAGELRSMSTRRRSARQLNGGGAMTKIDNALVTELEAAAFRRLVEHLRERARRAEHRPHEHGGLLPQLPGQLVPGGGQRQGPRADQGGRARGHLRHALQGVAGQAPEGGYAPSRRPPSLPPPSRTGIDA